MTDDACHLNEDLDMYLYTNVHIVKILFTRLYHGMGVANFWDRYKNIHGLWTFTGSTSSSGVLDY